MTVKVLPVRTEAHVKMDSMATHASVRQALKVIVVTPTLTIVKVIPAKTGPNVLTVPMVTTALVLMGSQVGAINYFQAS